MEKKDKDQSIPTLAHHQKSDSEDFGEVASKADVEVTVVALDDDDSPPKEHEVFGEGDVNFKTLPW